MPNIFDIRFILIYLIVINLISFLAMFIDKKKARRGKWRVSEFSLLMLVILGGGIGGILGMRVFRHKTKKAKFYIGFPLIIFLQLALVGVIIYLRYV